MFYAISKERETTASHIKSPPSLLVRLAMQTQIMDQIQPIEFVVEDSSVFDDFL